MINLPYPWLHPQWEILSAALQQGRLPHALLLTGLQGMGKAAFAQHLAQLLLCEQQGEQATPCGQCTGCTLYTAGSHPDFFKVTPEEGSMVIKVDQIRALSGALSFSRHGPGSKVAIMEPAEAMNINASNSLLKTLEEPTDNTVLLLVSTQPARLPATIRSRCQTVRIEVPAQEIALDWLKGQYAGPQSEVYLRLANGAPLRALELAQGNTLEERQDHFKQLLGIYRGQQDPLSVAAKWARDDDLKGIRWMREWLMDLLRIRLTGQVQGIHSSDLLDGLQSLAQQLDSRIMFRQLDRINRTLKLANSSLNRQLMTEDVLLAWADRTS
jgi:DNA polymerase-3 subunit delta'